MGLPELLAVEVYGSTLVQWAVAALIAAAIVLVAAAARPVLARRVPALGATRLWLVALVAVDVGSRALEVAPNAQQLVDGIATIALFLQVGLWASALLQSWIERSQQRARQAGRAPSLAAAGFVGRIGLWALVVLLALDNLGINITALIAGLGIGGIAVALAVQNILGDLFASLSIVVDKPFVTGDFIIVDNFMGTVEHIGMKTTRLRSLDGEQIVFSNSDLLKGRIKNYKRMVERRVVFPLRLACDTPPDRLAEVPGIVRRLIEGHQQVRFERSHFHRFGDASLDIETIFWMTTPDYAACMDVQQAVNLALMREFEEKGIELAFPRAVTVRVDGRDRGKAEGDADVSEPGARPAQGRH